MEILSNHAQENVNNNESTSLWQIKEEAFNSYVEIPVWLLRSGIGSPLLLYQLLLSYQKQAEKLGLPTYHDLAEDLAVVPHKVYEYLDELEESGLADIERDNEGEVKWIHLFTQDKEMANSLVESGNLPEDYQELAKCLVVTSLPGNELMYRTEEGIEARLDEITKMSVLMPDGQWVTKEVVKD